MVYYYTAKLALKSAEFIDEILEDGNYLMYPYELNYITGIDRGRKDIYEKINKEYESLCEEYRPHLEVLNHYGIQTDFSVKTDNLKNALPKKLSIEDELSSFVKRTNSKDILTITLFKTLYYYQVQYFPEQMNTVLEGIIADINMKLQDFDQRTKGIVKSRIIKELRSKRKIRPKVEM